MLYIATEIWLNITVFWIFWVTFVTIHVLCFATGQNDTVNHPFLTFWKIKWYFSDIAVSFNFLVIGIDIFDKKYLENALKQSQIRIFQTVSFCPNHAVSFRPSDLLFTVLVTTEKYDTPHSSDYLETYQYLYSSIYTIQLKYISTTFFTFIK